MKNTCEIITENRTYNADSVWIGAPGACHAWTMYRTSFTAKKGDAVSLLFSAAEYGVVYVNGTLVSRCFLRSYIYDKAYRAFDITPLVCAGNNTVAVHICDSGEEARCGFLLEVQSGGKAYPLSAWRFRPDTSIVAPCHYMVGGAAYCETVKMAEREEAWTEKPYDDSAWTLANVLGPVGRFPFEKMVQSRKKAETDAELLPCACTRDLFAPHAGKALRLQAEAGCNSVWFCTVSCQKDSCITLACREETAALYADGNPTAEETLSLSAGLHTVALLSYGGSPAFFLSYPEAVAVGTWYIYSVPQTKAPFIYPWNEPRLPRAIPSELAECLHTPDAFLSKAKPAVCAVPDEYYMLTHGVYTGRKAETPGALSLEKGERVIYDFEYERLGLFSLSFTAPKNARLALISYELEENGSICYMSRYSMTLLISRGDSQTWTSVRRRGLRYLAVIALDADAQIEKAGVVETRYPCEPLPFRCSDSLINDIYQMSVHTAQCCMMDMYVDCPGYEQNVWVGDAGITGMVNMVCFGESVFDGEYLRTIGLSMDAGLERFYRTGNPRYVAGQYLPCACFPTYPEGGIPVWSFTYLLQGMAHYLYCGADMYTDSFLSDMEKAFDRCLALTNERGLLSVDGAWNLIEWANNDLDFCGEATANSCMLSACFARAASLMHALGKPDKEKEYADHARAYKEAVNRYCYDEEQGAYTDMVRDEVAYAHYTEVYKQKNREPLSYEAYKARARISVQTNAFAVLFGCAEGKRKESAFAIVKDAAAKGGYVSGTPSNITSDASAYGRDRAVGIGTPFFLYYVLDTLIKEGEYDLALSVIRREWGHFYNAGIRTCPETFPTIKGTQGRSMAHAWSASPAVFLMRDILGVCPTEPGFASFTVTPHLGSLSFAEGSVPTPHGPIFVSAKRENGEVKVTVQAPSACVQK